MNDLALLLVDDDALLLSALVRPLRGRVTVRTATSGEKALELLRAGPNDYFAVVSDIHMPGMERTDVPRGGGPRRASNAGDSHVGTTRDGGAP